ncbi:Protein of unknown function [Pyronema omphalodes CBS 100304]|uniref:Uncharacterized protein n=1 Tax=Pyronema omphalodes (strain CBS 100304) TaxID=1076935 RepID=U4KWX2_PYROM|nr:Protein of unknown function [Pyronema omphalodes CBS 100304]
MAVTSKRKNRRDDARSRKRRRRQFDSPRALPSIDSGLSTTMPSTAKSPVVPAPSTSDEPSTPTQPSIPVGPSTESTPPAASLNSDGISYFATEQEFHQYFAEHKVTATDLAQKSFQCWNQGF